MLTNGRSIVPVAPPGYDTFDDMERHGPYPANRTVPDGVTGPGDQSRATVVNGNSRSISNRWLVSGDLQELHTKCC